MKLAVIKTGGKQYLVQEKGKLLVEKLKAEKTVTFDQVLLFVDDSKVEIGTPYLKNVKVEANILEQTKGPKVRILKYKAKKRFRKKQGHRQNYTRIEITKIG